MSDSIRSFLFSERIYAPMAEPEMVPLARSCEFTFSLIPSCWLIRCCDRFSNVLGIARRPRPRGHRVGNRCIAAAHMCTALSTGRHLPKVPEWGDGARPQ